MNKLNGKIENINKKLIYDFKNSRSVTEEISTSFTEKYFNSLSKNILGILSLLLSKNEKNLVDNVKNNLQHIYLNHFEYLSEVFTKTGIANVTMLGDMHNGGKCTLLVEKENEKFIYKPLNVDLLSNLSAILNLVNTTGFFDFYLLKILTNGDKYSIIEFINNQEKSDININKFSYHYGALVTIMALIRGIDFHNENIFCVNSTPVIIDCESLYYPVIKDTKEHDIDATSMLPTELNRQSLMNHYTLSINEMLRGVDVVCDIIQEKSDDFKKIFLWGSKIRGRMILKPTRFYYKVLENSLHPEFLISSEKRKKYIIDCLEGEHVISKAVINFECHDLMNFDIPYFSYYNGKLFSSKNEEIIQDICFDSLNIIYSNTNRINDLKSNVIERLRKYDN